MKEPHFYGAPLGGYRYDGPGDRYLNNTWISRRDQYLRLYAGRPERILIDASTTTMFWPNAIEQIEKDVEGGATYFAVLRHPIDRAVSAYARLRGQGLEPEGSLVAAVRQELAGHRRTWSPGFRYFEQGIYTEALDRLESVAGTRLHIVDFAELTANPAEVTRNAWRVLGLATTEEPNVGAERNASPHAKNVAMRFLLVRPLRARSAIARLVPQPVVERLKARRSQSRAMYTPSTAERSELQAMYADDLNALRDSHGVDLSGSASRQKN